MKRRSNRNRTVRVRDRDVTAAVTEATRSGVTLLPLPGLGRVIRVTRDV